MIAITSILATSTIMALRFFGLLEGLELWTFDRMLQFRFPEPPDPRIVIIELTEADFPEQNTSKLPASKLNEALNKIKPLNPGIIGLDFNPSYINYVTKQEKSDLTTTLQDNPSIISICLQPTVNAQGKIVSSGSKPYSAEQISRDRIGFSNFADDELTKTSAGGIIRRQKLISAPLVSNAVTPKPISAPLVSNAVTPKPASKDCTVTESFSLLVARRWLEAKRGISYNPPDLNNFDQLIKLGDVTLPKVDAYTGGYWNRDIRDYQVLLNYRPGETAKKVRLDQFLYDSKNNSNAYQDWIQNNIVLIGLTVETDKTNDHSFTPYGKLPGVEIHAHMISQLLSATLDQRPLLWSLPEWNKIVCIGVGSLAGSLVAWRLRKPYQFWQLVVFSVFGYLVGCWLVLSCLGLWLPALPVSLGFLLAAGWLRYKKNCSLRSKLW